MELHIYSTYLPETTIYVCKQAIYIHTYIYIGKRAVRQHNNPPWPAQAVSATVLLGGVETETTVYYLQLHNLKENLYVTITFCNSSIYYTIII